MKSFLSKFFLIAILLNFVNLPILAMLDRHASRSTDLTVIACHGNADRLIQVIQEGGNVNKIDPHDGRSPLFCAAKNHNPRIAELLINAGANIAVVDKNGFTPLIVAAELGNHKVIKLLIDEYKHRLNFNSDLTDTQRQRKLSDYINKQTTQIGQTALLAAIRRGQPHAVAMLVLAGADPNITNKRGDSALDIAARANSEEIAKILSAKKGVVPEVFKSKPKLYRAAKEGQQGGINLIENYVKQAG